MKLKLIFSDGRALTELTPKQQQRFIDELSRQQDENIKFGMELSLMILGYEVVEDEE